jgi:hypothetical protein
MENNLNTMKKTVLTNGLFPGDWILLKAIIFTTIALYFGYNAILEYQSFIELYTGITIEIQNPNVNELPVHRITELLGSEEFINATAQQKRAILIALKDEIGNFVLKTPNLSELAISKAQGIMDLCANLATDLDEMANKEVFNNSLVEANKKIAEIKARSK